MDPSNDIRAGIKVGCQYLRRQIDQLDRQSRAKAKEASQSKTFAEVDGHMLSKVIGCIKALNEVKRAQTEQEAADRLNRLTDEELEELATQDNPGLAAVIGINRDSAIALPRKLADE